MRQAEMTRETQETRIHVRLNLDGRGEASLSTGIGFLDHMLTLLARHARIDLEVDALGDLQVDDHHKIEAMFKAFARSLRDAAAIDPDHAGDIPSTKGVL